MLKTSVILHETRCILRDGADEHTPIAALKIKLIAPVSKPYKERGQTSQCYTIYKPKNALTVQLTTSACYRDPISLQNTPTPKIRAAASCKESTQQNSMRHAG